MVLRSRVGIAATVLVFCGCGSQVIPTAVVEGTTATITIPGRFEVGYGRRWASNPTVSPAPPYDPTTGLEDLQRGEMILTLTNAVGGEVTKLPVRFIGRVAVDPASNYATSGGSGDTQVIAIVDIPRDLVREPLESIDYGIKVDRWRRKVDGTFELVPQGALSPWYGWGSADGGSGAQTIPITIVDAPLPDALEVTRYTPVEGWDEYSGTVRKGVTFEGSLDGTKPFPEFRIQLPNNGSARPYAWEMEVNYPARRMRVMGVRALHGAPNGALVSWTTSPSTPPTGPCTSSPGTLKIQVVAPDNCPSCGSSGSSLQVRGVVVAFMLANQLEPTCQTRIADGDVTIVPGSVKRYSLNGALLSSGPAFAIVARDLQ